jgi:hypothetical protein
MNCTIRFSILAGALLLGACATVPSGPSVMALPGTGKTFDRFRADDMDCRQYADVQIGGTNANQAAGESIAKSAALGTVVGAAAGAALGGSSGAGVGAGSGLLIGTLAGTGAGDRSAYGVQRRYDYAYVQCMYAQGHKVPVSGGRFEAMRAGPSAPPAPAYYAPPPPPPPPPPGPR